VLPLLVFVDNDVLVLLLARPPPEACRDMIGLLLDEDGAGGSAFAASDFAFKAAIRSATVDIFLYWF
jgi:hypothetical protein